MKTGLSGHVVNMKFFKKIAIQEIAFMILNSVFLYVSWRKEINVKRFLKLVMIFVQPIYHVLMDTARTLDSVTNKIPIDFSETDSYRKWLFTVQVDDGYFGPISVTLKRISATLSITRSLLTIAPYNL